MCVQDYKSIGVVRSISISNHALLSTDVTNKKKDYNFPSCYVRGDLLQPKSRSTFSVATFFWFFFIYNIYEKQIEFGIVRISSKLAYYFFFRFLSVL